MTSRPAPSAVLRTSLAACAASLLLTSAAAAQGQAPPTQAQAHFTQAMQLFDKGEVPSACRTFEQSFEEEPAPGTLYNMAICHQREGLLGKAYRELDELATRAEEQKLVDKAKAVRAKADAIVPKLGILHLVHRADARADVTALTLDGESLPKESWRRSVLVDPAAHTLIVQHSDGVAVTRQVPTLAAGQTVTLEMEDPAPSGALLHPGLRLAAYVTGGIGAALLVGGSVAGVVAIIKKSKVDSYCQDGKCTNLMLGTTAQNQGKAAAAVSTVGFAAGGALLATGVVLFLMSREKASSEGSSAAIVAPFADAHGGGLGVAGHF